MREVFAVTPPFHCLTCLVVFILVEYVGQIATILQEVVPKIRKKLSDDYFGTFLDKVLVAKSPIGWCAGS